MPRSSKSVSPNTLGGVIRSARQNQHLSLAQVAGNKYSTSPVSQNERKRIEPSAESLHYLAERLNLPLYELMVLVQQHRESGTEESKFKKFEEKRMKANQILAEKYPPKALG